MDNIANPSFILSTISTPAIITLSPAQYASYLNEGLALHAPDGSFLCKIAERFTQEETMTADQVANHANLVEHLLFSIKNIELPDKTIRGLEDLMYRARNLDDKAN